MKKNKKSELKVKRLSFNISRYLIHTIDYQYLNDLKSENLKKFYELVNKSKLEANDLISLFSECISELEKDIDFLDNIDERLLEVSNNG